MSLSSVGNFLKEAPVACASLCKSVAEKFEGVTKCAGVVLPLIAIIKYHNTDKPLETSGIISDQVKIIQAFNPVVSFVGTVHNLCTKPWDAEWVTLGNVKRLAFTFFSFFEVNDYLKLIKAPHLSLSYVIREVTIGQTLVTIGVVLTLIENGRNWWNSGAKFEKLKNKNIELLVNNPVTLGKVQAKLSNRRDSLRTQLLKPEEVFVNRAMIKDLVQQEKRLQDELDKIKVIMNFDPNDQSRFVYEFSSQADEVKFNSLSNQLATVQNQKSGLLNIQQINNLRLEVIDKLGTVDLEADQVPAEELTRLRGLAHALKLMKNPNSKNLADVELILKNSRAFIVYKNNKYAVREENLNQEKVATYWKIATNVAQLGSIGLGVSKAFFGLEVLMKVLNLTSEKDFDYVSSWAKLVSGSFGLKKYLIDVQIPKNEPTVTEACAAA